MTIPLVWSERVESAGVTGLHDCTEASALMVLVAAGFTRFPLGIYTPEERNALDASSTNQPNTGDLLADIDGAVAKRYGVAMHRLPITTTAALAAELSKPGRAYLLAGSLGHYPADDPLRRWQPKYEGGHAVCVLPVAGGQVHWLDPLAPNQYAGDLISATKAAQFAWQNWEGRYLALGELATVADTATATPSETDMTTTITITRLPAGSRVRFAPGSVTPLYDAQVLGAAVKSISAPADRGTWADVDASVQIVRNPKAVPNGTFRRIALDSPYNPGLLVLKDDVELEVGTVPIPGASPAELASARREGAEAAAAAARAVADSYQP